MLDNKIRTDVFISSTSIDLPEYREAVMKTLLGLGLFPIGMETWPKTGENPVDKCKRMVDESEIYIGIYAYRYGWQPNGDGTKSITEMEYDWAGEKGIPRLCFIMSDKHPWPEDRKEKAKQKELDAFKERVSTDEVGFFTTPDDLAKQVAIALARFVQVKPNLTPYYNWLHNQSHQSGLLRVLRARDATNSEVRSINIEEVYTPLLVERMVERTPEGQPILTAKLDHDKLDKQDKELSPLSAMEATNAYSRLVMLGDPGCGKSTFVNYLALCMTGNFLYPDGEWMNRLHEQGWVHGEYLPVTIILRDFASTATEGTVKGVIEHLNDMFIKWELGEVTIKGVQHYLNIGRALVLFDGLDEVPNDKRQLVRDAIQEFMTRFHADNRYIVTCRKLSYAQREWQIEGMHSTEIFAPFNADQIDHFVKAWYTALVAMRDIDTQKADMRVQDLAQGLSDRALQAVASNPMLLTVMAIVHNHTGTLPRERARLYDECVKLLMERWKPQDFVSLREALGFDNDGILYEMLWEIAYKAHQGQADRDDAADILQHEIFDIIGDERYLNEKWDLAEQFCKYIETRAGLLVGRGSGKGMSKVFSFPHRTFQEFLAGCFIATSDFQGYAPQVAMLGTNWREVLRFATGYLVYVEKNRVTDALRGVNAIFDMVEEAESMTDDHWRAIWLAGQMLDEVKIENAQRHDIGKRAIRRTKTALVQLIEGGHLPPVERAGAGRILSQLGDPRQGVGTITVNGITLPDVVWCHIPAGEFIIGSDNHEPREKPAHTLHLDDFYMSRYLVTYAQYQAFENAPDFGDDEWWDGFLDEYKRMSTNQAFPFANHPQECVSWYGAMAFCRWLTYHINQAGVPMQVWDMATKRYMEMPYPTMKITLPSEAEYEKMARGTDGRIYPYGNDYDPNKGNTRDTGIGMTSAVGMFPQGESPYGVLDASDNVWTWTRSLNILYKYNSKDGREDKNSTRVRILRGGSWNYNSEFARASSRYYDPPSGWFNFVGFFVACRPY